MGLDHALGRLDAAAIARDVAALVAVPSVTGDERAALERLVQLAGALGARADAPGRGRAPPQPLGGLAGALGLRAGLVRHDLGALRAHPDHPGEEAPRSELWGLTVTVPGHGRRPLAVCGHVDVVPPGAEPWTHGSPWSGAIDDGFVYGRGSVDMKGGVVAALHALAALGPSRPGGEVV